MKAVLQRVQEATVTVEDQPTGAIGLGYMILVGVHKEDTSADAAWLAQKIFDLRLWPDESGKMNLDLAEAGGSLLIVSQFTLYGNARKGRRPSFDQAAQPELGQRLYEEFVAHCRALMSQRHPNGRVATGRFGAMMKVALVNWGPVTILVESRESRRS